MGRNMPYTGRMQAARKPHAGRNLGARVQDVSAAMRLVMCLPQPRTLSADTAAMAKTRAGILQNTRPLVLLGFRQRAFF